MEIVVTGRTGKLGGALGRAWTAAGLDQVVVLGREVLDLRRPERLREALRGRKFDALVNCAAMAGVEGCEARPEEARLVNAVAPGVLAELCRERGARFLHFSTDYVLDGRSPGLKGEDAPVDPLGSYARTKREGELRVLEADRSALVCRVSWLFGTEPPGFIEVLVERARRGEDLGAVADKFSKPTSVAALARVVPALLARPELGGIFHLAHEGEPESWWSSGRKALDLAAAMGLLDWPGELRRQRLADAEGLAVPRPVHTAMAPRRLGEELGLTLGSWEDAARERWRSLLGEGRNGPDGHNDPRHESH